MKALRTIRGRMMICYTGIIVFTVLIMSIIYYRQTAASLESRASESLLQLAINNNATLDAAIENMDGTANRIISSDLIKDVFYIETATTSQYLQNRKAILDLLFTVNGSKIGNQINLISTSGKFVEFGRAFDVAYRDQPPLDACPWMAGCLAREGKPYLVSPRVYEWDGSGRVVFSVCRAFNSTFGAPYDAAVEILMDYDELARTVEQAVRPDTVSARLYDASGRQIYPQEEVGTDYWALLPPDAADGVVPLGSGGSAEMAAFHRSAYSGLTMVITESEADLLAPVRAFRGRLAVIGALLLAITTAITYVLSKQLSEPIRSIQKSISSLELDDLHAAGPDRYPGSAYELDKLGRSYTQMVDRLQRSLEETVTARSHATEARMQALQSQMNPHFLYNTITVISIKAEDNEDYEVVGMCECLTGMLRYVTRSTAGDASMAEELDYLDQYLYLMHCRYPGRFSAEIDVPEEMRALTVPRLVLQPLAENSFKHGFQRSGPWALTLTGAVEDGVWRITATDNGVGFPEETLEQLRGRFAATAGDFRAAGAEHIGLANIFERLRFHYRERAVFEIENLPGGGCRVTIGGVCTPAPEEALPE